MNFPETDWPLYIYRFDASGKHSGKEQLENMGAVEWAITRAIQLRETVTITDSGDDCVFRCEEGHIEWPRLDTLFPNKSLDGYGMDLSGLLS